MTNEQILGNRKWAAHLTVDQMKAQLAWEQHPDFARVTEENRAKDAARREASYQGWLAEQKAKEETNPYKAAVAKEKEIKKMGRRYYGRGVR